jgi:predicted membrane GTPase involved in stress response
VEVTPSAVRLRKMVLDGKERMRERGRRARGAE